MRTGNASGSNYYRNKEQGCVKESIELPEKSHEPGISGEKIFKPLNTGWIDERVACVREWVANIFFYTKNGTTIMR